LRSSVGRRSLLADVPRIRTLSEDFRVEEIPLYEPTGAGPYTAVLIEKRDLNTEEVVARWSRQLELAPREIGFAGRKDRRAVCRQWLTVPGLDPSSAARLEGEGVRVLEAARHAHRLRPGDLIANRFSLTVRELGEGEGELALERLEQVARQGMRNRFGQQRFGREGDNAVGGAAVLRGERVAGNDRHRRFLVSALQAELFHQVLDRREAPASTVLAGDVLLQHATGRLTPAAGSPEEQEAADLLQLSPTGPLYGEKMRSARGATGELERRVWDETGLPDWHGRRRPRTRVRGGRRAFCVPVGELSSLLHADRLDLSFRLPAGSYATVLVAALFDRTVVEGADDA
jgi:tRNA pseudouridine13 synthase